MTVIEKQYMDSVINISRMMRKAQDAEPDWEQRRYEIAKEVYPLLLENSSRLACGDGEILAVAAVGAVNAAEILVEALKTRPYKEEK